MEASRFFAPFGEYLVMALIAILLLFIMAIAGLVAMFVAYPHRGRQIPRTVPHAEWLDDTMVKASNRVNDYVQGRGVTSHE